jgi:hypothetical protein
MTQEEALTARIAWGAILAVLQLPETTDLDKVNISLQRTSRRHVAAVQLIARGSGLAEENTVVTGKYDQLRDLPTLNKLYGGAGGSSFRFDQIPHYQ